MIKILKMEASTFLFLILAFATGQLLAVSVEKDLSMTLKEKQTLDKFREQVKPLLKNDFMKRDIYLVRWLRAKNFDINSAEQMLKENLRWRHENKIDTIQTEDFKDMFRDYPTSVDTYDREGRPIGVIDVFDWDIREAVVSGRGGRLLRYMDLLMDNLTLQVYERQQKGMNVTQWKVIANAESFNMVTHGCPICIPLWVQFLSSVENHFRGWMDEFIIIESPTAVYTIIDILRPFLSRQTRDSLKILGQNNNVWMPYLDSKISREERRAPYGGTKAPVRN